MQNIINHICSEDASHLKSHMGLYAAPLPDKQVVQPVITKDSKSYSRIGFNHPELVKMLCPVKYLVDYVKDLADGSLKVTTALWPTYLHPGDKPGQDFDPDNIIEGLLQGYLLE
ncbi:hypothetical protein EDB19DRAFT_1646862 [Suillus lakei]|nr:hypothetical protein EDB19DRAFT_1646862 [Suillus lakei]